MYEWICLYLFDKVIVMLGYKQDKFIRVIKSSWMISEHRTTYIYMCVCVCVCIYIYMYIYIYINFMSRNFNPRDYLRDLGVCGGGL
jgi:hypothetical protein